MSAPQVWNWHGDMHMELLLQECTAWDWSVFPAGVRFPSGCAAEVQEQKHLLWDAAAFLLSSQIPALVRLVRKIKFELVSDVLMFSFCVCVAAGGLSGPHGGADGRGDPDFGAAPAGRKRAIPGRHTEGAGKEWEQREAQPHTGELLSNNINHFTYTVRLQSLSED